MSKDEIYDLSAKEREVVEWRAQRRLELRNLYLKELHHPNMPHDGYIFDPQMQRFYTATFSYEKTARPTIPNFLWFIGVSFGGMLYLGWRVRKYRDAREERFRTGQVSYRDRDWKFV